MGFKASGLSAAVPEGRCKSIRLLSFADFHDCFDFSAQPGRAINCVLGIWLESI